MTDFGIHPRNLAELIDNWDWDGEGTLGQQIQEAAESHSLTQARPRNLAETAVEYAVEVKWEGKWAYWCAWTDRASAEEERDMAFSRHPEARLVRRLIGYPEVIE